MTANVLEWLKQAGGEYDAEKIALKDYQEMGMGVVALQDIPVDTRTASRRANYSVLTIRLGRHCAVLGAG
jgi:hypothetical protein